MAPLSSNGISHFMHSAHKLNFLTTNTPYLCNGCQVPGTGSRFICTICSFDLHEFCANCPTLLTSSTTSHQHPMSRVVYTNPNLTESCQTCRNPIKGLAYQCKDCNIWIHPLCVSTKSGHNQNRSTAPSGYAPAVAAATQTLAGKIGVQVALSGISAYALNDKANEVPSVDSNVSMSSNVPSAGPSVDSNVSISSNVPSAGFGHEEPSAGFTVEPSAGFGVEPSAGFSVEPSAGFGVEPSAGFSVEPSAGFGVEHDVGDTSGGITGFFLSLFESSS